MEWTINVFFLLRQFRIWVVNKVGDVWVNLYVMNLCPTFLPKPKKIMKNLNEFNKKVRTHINLQNISKATIKTYEFISLTFLQNSFKF